MNSNNGTHDDIASDQGTPERIKDNQSKNDQNTHDRSEHLPRVANPDTPGNSSNAFTVLVIDDEESARNLCAEVAEEAGLRVRAAATTEEALEILEQYPVDIALTDIRVPALGGIELLRRMRASFPRIAVLMMTQYGTIETAVQHQRLLFRHPDLLL